MRRKEASQTKPAKTQVTLEMGRRAPLVTLEDGRIYIDWVSGKREITVSLPADSAHLLAADLLEATRNFCDSQAGT